MSAKMTSQRFHEFLLSTTILTFVAFGRGDDDGLGLTLCEEMHLEGDPTLCRVLIEENTDIVGEFQLLQAEGAIKVKTQLYPSDKEFKYALISYDEPASLFPIPLGASVWLSCLMGLLSLYYLSSFFSNVLSEVKKAMNLRPHTAKFPSLPLYWLQQSKREISLRREFRNTWAWLAKRYLLSPDDPLLGDIDEVMGRTTWADFHVPRGTWSTIDVTLKLNHLCIEIERDETGNTSYFVRRAVTARPKKLHLFSILTKLKTQFGNLDQAQRDRQDEKHVQEIESQRVSSDSDESGDSDQSGNEVHHLVKEALKTNSPLPIRIEDHKPNAGDRRDSVRSTLSELVRSSLTVTDNHSYHHDAIRAHHRRKPESPPELESPPRRVLHSAPVHKIKAKEVKPFAFTSKKVGDIRKMKEQIEAQLEDEPDTYPSYQQHHKAQQKSSHHKVMAISRKPKKERSMAVIEMQRYVDEHNRKSATNMQEKGKGSKRRKISGSLAQGDESHKSKDHKTKENAKNNSKDKSKHHRSRKTSKERSNPSRRRKKSSAERRTSSGHLRRKTHAVDQLEDMPSELIIVNTHGLDDDVIVDLFGTEQEQRHSDFNAEETGQQAEIARHSTTNEGFGEVKGHHTKHSKKTKEIKKKSKPNKSHKKRK